MCFCQHFKNRQYSAALDVFWRKVSSGYVYGACQHIGDAMLILLLIQQSTDGDGNMQRNVVMCWKKYMQNIR